MVLQRAYSLLAKDKKRASDCYILCTVQTVVGRDPTDIDAPQVSTPMTSAELAKPLRDALAKDDPKAGVCPGLPPYVPPKA